MVEEGIVQELEVQFASVKQTNAGSGRRAKMLLCGAGNPGITIRLHYSGRT